MNIIVDPQQRTNFFEEKLTQLQHVADYRVYEDWTVYDVTKIVAVATTIFLGMNYVFGATLLKSYTVFQWYRTAYAAIDSFNLISGAISIISSCFWAVVQNFLPDKIDQSFAEAVEVTPFLRFYQDKLVESSDFWKMQDRKTLLAILQKKITNHPQAAMLQIPERILTALDEYWRHNNGIPQEIGDCPIDELLKYRSVILSANQQISWELRASKELLKRLREKLEEDPLQLQRLDEALISAINLDISRDLRTEEKSLRELNQIYQDCLALREDLRNLPWNQFKQKKIVEAAAEKLEPGLIELCCKPLLEELIPIFEGNVRNIPLIIPKVRLEVGLEDVLDSAWQLDVEEFVRTHEGILTLDPIDFWTESTQKQLFTILLKKIEQNASKWYPLLNQDIKKNLEKHWRLENHIPKEEIEELTLEKLLLCRNAILAANQNIPWQKDTINKLLDHILDKLKENPADLAQIDQNLEIALIAYFLSKQEVLEDRDLNFCLQKYQEHLQISEDIRNLPWYAKERRKILDAIVHKISPESVNEFTPELIQEILPILELNAQNIPFIVKEMKAKQGHFDRPVGGLDSEYDHFISVLYDKAVEVSKKSIADALQLEDLIEKQRTLGQALSTCLPILTNLASKKRDADRALLNELGSVADTLVGRTFNHEPLTHEIRQDLATFLVYKNGRSQEPVSTHVLRKIFLQENPIDRESSIFKELLEINLARHLYLRTHIDGLQFPESAPDPQNYLLFMMQNNSISLASFARRLSKVERLYLRLTHKASQDIAWPTELDVTLSGDRINRDREVVIKNRAYIIKSVFNWATRSSHVNEDYKIVQLLNALEASWDMEEVVTASDVEWIITELNRLSSTKKHKLSTRFNSEPFKSFRGGVLKKLNANYLP